MTHVRRKRRSPEEIRDILDRWGRSGQSKSAFARAEGIPLSTLAKWFSSPRPNKTRPSSHRRIRKLGSVAPSTRGVEIVLPQGHRVVVPVATSASELEAVLRAVLNCSA